MNGYRVLYQPYMMCKESACGIIDEGFINGYKAISDEVVVWDSERQPENLEPLLNELHPTHFVGYLQMPDRSNSSWTNSSQLVLLNKYKRLSSMKVIINSFPSNLRDLFGDWLSTTKEHVDAGVKSFYLQKERPNETEIKVLRSRIIDLITSRFCIENIETLFRNYLDYEIPVLDEPPAADTTFYLSDKSDQNNKVNENIDILFVGNCWSFKWQNMGPYIVKLKETFGEKFKVYGNGWPEGISEGMMSNEKFTFISRRAKINLCFHEPSQVLGFATAGNERIFKQLAIGCFVISDPCATFSYYFSKGKHLVAARSPDEMLEQVKYYLPRSEERSQIAANGQKHVLKEHTYRCRAKRVFKVLEYPEGKVMGHVGNIEI